LRAWTVRFSFRVLACALGLLSACAVQAEPPPAAKLGTKIESISFPQGTGGPLNLYDLKGKQAVVVVFLSFECPVSTSYAQPLADLAKTYGERGVAFVGVVPAAD